MDDMAALQKRIDWSDAMIEDRARDQQAWVAKWMAAHTWIENPNGGHIGIPDPDWVWPKRESRKVAIRATDEERQVKQKSR